MSAIPSTGEHPPSSSPTSPSTAVTTPEQDPNDGDDNVDNDDDIWGSDSPDLNSPTTRPARREELLSDLPTIKRQHMTDGYREGLAVGKAKVMQQGFDAGYPIGMQIALRAGTILGVLEGFLASKTTAALSSSSSSSSSSPDEDRASLQKIHDRAQAELSCSALLKDVNDEVIAEATTVPSFIEEVLLKWEQAVLLPIRQQMKP